ncbi:MAG: hypothetical protein ACYTXA_05380 [Nostoc sp.]
MGGAERNPTDYQDVGFGKASNATCYNAGNPRNAVAPQPTIFLQHSSQEGLHKTTEIFSEIKYDSYSYLRKRCLRWSLSLLALSFAVLRRSCKLRVASGREGSGREVRATATQKHTPLQLEKTEGSMLLGNKK